MLEKGGTSPDLIDRSRKFRCIPPCVSGARNALHALARQVLDNCSIFGSFIKSKAIRGEQNQNVREGFEKMRLRDE
ncbi:hypothetical protein [Bradyrhizobium sp. UFLA05-112]